MKYSGTAVFVMPRPRAAWADAGALWITAAGWAEAAETDFESAVVVTPERQWTAAEVLGYRPVSSSLRPGLAKRIARRLPMMANTLAKDVRLAVNARRTNRILEKTQIAPRPSLIWQHHDPFARSGAIIARQTGAPLILFVHAPQVWEAARWGVSRPGWGRLIERYGEAPALQEADLVACVSEEVADELARFGVAPERIQVSPMSADCSKFHPNVDASSLRQDLGLAERLVVGWTGSFRRFHGLEQALEAFACLPELSPKPALLLVGDGQERARIAALSHQLGIQDDVFFTGSVQHNDMPHYVAAMDLALVVAQAGQPFHYSPLKLREYMASGVPAIVPSIGELARTIRHRDNGYHYTPGQVAELAKLIVELVTDVDSRRRVAAAAQREVAVEGTWRAQLNRAISRLDELGVGLSE